MTRPASPEELAAGSAYQDLHVPALFHEWAARVAEAAKIRPGDRVLDVACGTGVLAREAASRVGAQGSVTGLDPAPGMLAVARRLGPALEWREGTAEALPYADARFDAVVSQFGLMFFTDKSAALREMLRVLAPGRHLAVAVWDSLENSPAYADAVALLDRIVGTQAAAALRAPFVLGDRRALKELFEESGAPSVQIETHRGTARFPSIRVMVEADLRGWLPIMGVFLSEAQIERVLQEAEDDLRPYVTLDGTVEFDSPALIAWGPKA